MNRRFYAAAVLVALTALLLTTFARAQDQTAPGEPAERRVVEPRRPLIQIALLLDTSNSMDGLINQAKTHLWKIVNEFATARQDGQRPDLHVALFEYGNDGLPAEEGYVRLVVPMTTDLDKVSEELFALKTNGGSEWCGFVIDRATKTLSWSANTKDFKAVFIAGNEPFTQGTANYVDACKAAIAKGIIVNTIHCGPYDTGVNTKWKHGAELADGAYCHIDQNQQVVQINAPQDTEIAKLNTRLNGTYVFYGEAGAVAAERQVAQDAAADSLGRPVLAQRAATKAGSFYKNTATDLVDAIAAKKVKLEDVKEADLPEEMKKMTPEQRKAHIAKMTAERAKLQKQIQDLSDARKKYVAEEMKKQAAEGKDQTLEEAIVKTVREQAAKKDFKFEDKQEK